MNSECMDTDELHRGWQFGESSRFSNGGTGFFSVCGIGADVNVRLGYNVFFEFLPLSKLTMQKLMSVVENRHYMGAKIKNDQIATIV